MINCKDQVKIVFQILVEKLFRDFSLLCSSNNNKKLNLLTESSFLDIFSLTASLLLTVLVQHALITSS